MHEPFVLVLIGLGVPAAISLFLHLGQLAISRATPKRPGEARIPAAIGATGLLSGAFAGAILALGILGDMSPAHHDFWAWVALVAAFAAGGLYLTVGAGNWRMWVSEAGIQIRNEFGVIKPFVPWTSVVRVRPRWTSVIVFELRGGGAVKVPFGTLGLLAAVEAAYCHGAILDDEMISVLNEARQESNKAAEH